MTINTYLSRIDRPLNDDSDQQAEQRIDVTDICRTLDDLQRRLISWIDLLCSFNLLVYSLANAFGNGRAIDLGSRHGV